MKNRIRNILLEEAGLTEAQMADALEAERALGQALDQAFRMGQDMATVVGR